MKIVSNLLHALCASVLLLALPLPGEELTNSWQHSVTLTVSPNLMPAHVTLSETPLLVRISPARIPLFRYEDVLQADGSDLAFFDEAGTLLPYEIDEWNTSGESLVWVKVPTLRTYTTLTMKYGCAQATAQNATDVWQNYVGVWHCSQESGNLLDSTAHGYDLVPSRETMVALEAGAVGKARVAHGNSTYWSGSRSTHACTNAMEESTTFTISGWFQAKTVAGYARLFSSKTAYRESGGFEVELEDALDRVFARGGDNVGILAETPFFVGNWVHLAFVYHEASVSCYTNGALALTGTVHPATALGHGFAVGGNVNGTEQSWCGWFDEIRYRSGCLTPEQIHADYQMMKNPNCVVAHALAPDTVDTRLFSHVLVLSYEGNETIPRAAPVAIQLSPAQDGFTYEAFQDAQGADLCILDEQGHVLTHEIDEWNAASNGSSLIWVKMASLHPGSKLFVYYGSATYRAQGAPDVWRDFIGVWHMSEASGTVRDSTGHGLTATPGGANVMLNCGIVDGAVGCARENGGDGVYAHDAYLSVPNYDYFGATDTFTISGFFRLHNRAGWYRLFSRKPAGGSTGWGQEIVSGDPLKIVVYGGSARSTNVTGPSMVDEWTHLTFVYQGKKCYLYVNGAFSKVVEDIGAATANGLPLSIGCASSGGEWSLNGAYDEVRLCADALSPEQVQAHYQAMTTARAWRANAAYAQSPSDTPTPVVVRVETTQTAEEAHLQQGLFTISCDHAPTCAICVGYELTGTAQAGVDYQGASRGEVVIPPGALSVQLPIRPLYHTEATGDRTVVIQLVDVSSISSVGQALNGSVSLSFSQSSATMPLVALTQPTRHSFKRILRLSAPCAFLGEETVLTNFPVLVRLSTAISNFTYTDLRADGSDILFTDDHFETVYPHQIDEWNPNGESLVWVFIPRLKKDTHLRMYFKSPFDLGDASRRCLWPDYVGVWHFNEGATPQSGGVGVARLPALDASGHELDAYPQAANYTGQAKDFTDGTGGAVGHARWNQTGTYDGVGRNWYRVRSYDDLKVGDSFTVSGWIWGKKMLKYPRLLSRKTSYDASNGWEVELSQTFTDVYARAGSDKGAAGMIPSISNAWVHVAFTYETRGVKEVNPSTDKHLSTVKVYANGVLLGVNESCSPNQDNGQPLCFGCNATGNEASFCGAFDEFRLRRKAQSAPWIEAEYRSMAEPNFIQCDRVESAQPGLLILVR